MNIIHRVVDPKELLLVWKPPLNLVKKRSNLAIGKIVDENLIYLEESDDYLKAKSEGFCGYPAFPLRRKEYVGVMKTFLRRLPPRNRSDFPDFLAYYRLPADRELSNFALLANTGGKLPRDGFSVVCDLQTIDPPCELLMEVAGFRHQEAFKDGVRFPVGTEAYFQPEPINLNDPNAVQVIAGAHYIGYVNRLQTKGVRRWLDSGKSIKATIDRINGTPERPIIYLFLEVK